MKMMADTAHVLTCMSPGAAFDGWILVSKELNGIKDHYVNGFMVVVCREGQEGDLWGFDITESYMGRPENNRYPWGRLPVDTEAEFELYPVQKVYHVSYRRAVNEVVR